MQPQKHYAKWKKLDSKDQTLHGSTCRKIQTEQIIYGQKLLGGQSGQYLLNAWGFLPG